MKAYEIAALCTLVLLVNYAMFSQTSVLFDSTAGNYRIQYVGERGPMEVIFEPSTKIEPIINAVVSADREKASLRYTYTAALKAESKQHLLSIMIEFQSDLNGYQVPNETWVADSFSFTRIWEWSNVKKDPRGLWVEALDVGPGTALSGFVLWSNGLPAIVSCHFMGNALGVMFPDEPPQDVEDLVDSLESFPSNTVKGKTLGPKDLPYPFTALSFLDTITSYKHQSADLGWIINKGIINSLDQKLENARKLLVQGNNKAAKNTLEAFVNEVEALNKKGKQLTSEAYALLKFNAEYLISKL